MEKNHRECGRVNPTSQSLLERDKQFQSVKFNAKEGRAPAAYIVLTFWEKDGKSLTKLPFDGAQNNPKRIVA